MNKRNKKKNHKKKRTTCDSRELTSILLSDLKSFFPVRDGDSLHQIFKLISEKIKIQFDLSFLEAELLLVTRKVHLQLKIRGFFNQIRVQFGENKLKKTNKFRIPTDNSKTAIEEIWEKSKKISRKNSEPITKIYSPKISNQEYDGDIIHTK